LIEDVVSHLAEPTEPGGAATLSCGRQGSPWHVLWTRSHCERLVGDQLAAKGFEVFLPSVSAWSALGGVRRRSGGPLFPGYLFLHHAVDKESFLEVRKARGLVRILGERWDRLGVVPEAEGAGGRRSGAPLRLPAGRPAHANHARRAQGSGRDPGAGQAHERPAGPLRGAAETKRGGGSGLYLSGGGGFAASPIPAGGRATQSPPPASELTLGRPDPRGADTKTLRPAGANHKGWTSHDDRRFG